MGTLETSCRCGEVVVRLDVPRKGGCTRTVCYCDDCQTAPRALGAEAHVLGPGSGTDLVQSTPDLLHIDKGADRLGVLRLSPKGLFRWYARCCDTPMFNTLANLKLGFVGVIIPAEASKQVDAAFGAPRAHVFTTTARPRSEAPRKDVGFSVAGYGVLSRLFAAKISGRSKHSPLMQEDGTPIAKIRVLTKEERHDARPG